MLAIAAPSEQRQLSPLFFLLSCCAAVDQLQQPPKKLVIHDQQNGPNDVIHQHGHRNLPTIFS